MMLAVTPLHSPRALISRTSVDLDSKIPRISSRKCLAVKIPSPISTSSLKMFISKNLVESPMMQWTNWRKP
eukprot:symbB.v1.2.002544.t1/scaffold103.1/size331058/9